MLVLIVDDDPLFRAAMARGFRGRGFLVSQAGSAGEAGRKLAEAKPDLAVVDLFLPELCGLELVAEVLSRAPAARVVVVSGYSSVATAVEAMRLGAVGYVSKPTTCEKILDAAVAAPDASRALGRMASPSLARLEWEHLNRVVAECAGNVTEAARRLGIDRRTLQRKLRKRPPAH